MKQVEMLDKCKERIGAKTSYALADALEIPKNRIYDYLKGQRAVDEYTCFKIAEILGESPSSIIAQIQAENAKSESKRLYFKRFFTIAGLWIIWGFALGSYMPFSSTAYAAGNTAETRASVDVTAHYTKYGLCRKWQFFADTLRVTGT